MRALIPWYMYGSFEEFLEGDIEYYLWNDPDKVPDEIRDWVLENAWEFLEADESQAATDYSIYYLDILKENIPSTINFEPVGKLNNDNELIEVEVTSSFFDIMDDVNILEEQDKLKKFLINQSYLPIDTYDVNDFFSELFNTDTEDSDTEDTDTNAEDTIDSEIKQELLSFDAENIDPCIIGGILLYSASKNFGNTTDLGVLVSDISAAAYDVFVSDGGWANYMDDSKLIEALNETFKFSSPIKFLSELEDYKVTKDDSGDITYEYRGESPGQLHLNFESLRALKTRLLSLLEDFSADAFNYMKKEYGLSDQSVKDEFNAKNQIDNSIEDDEDIYYQAVQRMSPDEVSHHESDLYLKQTPISNELIAKYPYKNNVTTFRSQIDNSIWFEIPFAYTPVWKEREKRSRQENLQKVPMTRKQQLTERLNQLLQINEISADLASKVATAREQQLDVLRNKYNKANNYAEKKRKKEQEAKSAEVKYIRERIAAILMDKPDESELPDLLEKQCRRYTTKIIKIPEFRSEAWGTKNGVWGYAGLSDDNGHKPVILISADSHHEYGIGWCYETLGSEYNFADELSTWQKALEIIENTYKDSEEELELKTKKAKRAAYDKARRAEKNAQKLAATKPFDKFLQQLADKFGSGYVARDDYGYIHVFKEQPRYIPTLDGYRDDEEIYEPGYWESEQSSESISEADFCKAYEAQYRKSAPSGKNALWQF